MKVTQQSVTGVGVSPWLPIDAYTNAPNEGVYIKPGAGATISVEVTADNIFDPAVTPIAFACGVASLTGATTNQAAALGFAARAVRLNQTVGATVSTIQVVGRGI